MTSGELDDSSNVGKHYHNKRLVFKIFSSSRWYYIFSIGFVINFIIVILLVYIFHWRSFKAGKVSLLERIIDIVQPLP